LTGEVGIIEVKHRVKQVLGWKTRGQATLLAMDAEKPVLAKAGLKLPTSATDQNAAIIDLFIRREYDTKLEHRQLRTLPQLWHGGGDLVGLSREVRVNMDYDFKCKPQKAEERFIEGVAVLFFETTPWESVQEFVVFREAHEGWRKSQRKTLKTRECYRDLINWMTIGKNRQRIYSAKNAVKTAIKLIVRAMEKGRWGLSRKGKTIGPQRNLWAIWFQGRGFKVTVSDFENAARPGALLEENVIPPDKEVLNLLDAIASEFPAFERERILAPTLIL
jgi:hypothetical protein